MQLSQKGLGQQSTPRQMQSTTKLDSLLEEVNTMAVQVGVTQPIDMIKAKSTMKLMDPDQQDLIRNLLG